MRQSTEIVFLVEDDPDGGDIRFAQSMIKSRLGGVKRNPTPIIT